MTIIALVTSISGRVAAYRIGKAREASMVREAEMLLGQLAHPRPVSREMARMHRMEALAARAFGDARTSDAKGAKFFAKMSRWEAASAVKDAYGLA